jgi:hypothetical protein
MNYRTRNRAREPSGRRAARLRLRGAQTASVESGENGELTVEENIVATARVVVRCL